MRLELEEALVEEVDALREDVRDDVRGDISSAARQTHASLMREIAALQEDLAMLRGHVHSARSELGSVHGALASAQQQLATAVHSHDSVRHELDSLRASMLDRSGPDPADLAMMRSELAELVSMRAGVEEARADVAAVRSDMRNTRSDLELVRTDVRAEVSSVRSDLGSVRSEVRAGLGEMRSDLGEVRADLGEVHSDLGELRSGLGNVRSEVGAVHDKLDREAVPAVGVAAVKVGAVRHTETFQVTRQTETARVEAADLPLQQRDKRGYGGDRWASVGLNDVGALDVSATDARAEKEDWWNGSGRRALPSPPPAPISDLGWHGSPVSDLGWQSIPEPSRMPAQMSPQPMPPSMPSQLSHPLSQSEPARGRHSRSARHSAEVEYDYAPDRTAYRSAPEQSGYKLPSIDHLPPAQRPEPDDSQIHHRMAYELSEDRWR